MDRVFLDANVLFSAAYDPSCRISQIWRLKGTELLVSPLVADEALRNMAAKFPAGMGDLQRLLKQCQFVNDAQSESIPVGIELARKDRPVLASALAAQADFLITGDKHFRAVFGRVIGKTTIMRPGDFLKLRG